ncbi:MAG: hypothetical protein ACM3PO_06185 [Betaproteobacteria bacterium]
MQTSFTHGQNAISIIRTRSILARIHPRASFGARPAEIPVQEPEKFTLSVNLNAARAIDLNLPQTLVARADQVIE